MTRTRHQAVLHLMQKTQWLHHERARFVHHTSVWKARRPIRSHHKRLSTISGIACGERARFSWRHCANDDYRPIVLATGRIECTVVAILHGWAGACFQRVGIFPHPHARAHHAGCVSAYYRKSLERTASDSVAAGCLMLAIVSPSSCPSALTAFDPKPSVQRGVSALCTLSRILRQAQDEGMFTPPLPDRYRRSGLLSLRCRWRGARLRGEPGSARTLEGRLPWGIAITHGRSPLQDR